MLRSSADEVIGWIAFNLFLRDNPSKNFGRVVDGLGAAGATTMALKKETFELYAKAIF